METVSFGSLKTITSTHYNRPDCTRQMLSHLSQCRGIENYILVCSVEPGFPEVIAEINKYPYQKMVFLNERLLGCWENKKAALVQGFKLGNYVIHIEDDVILAKDALEYFEWAAQFNFNSQVFSVSAFSKDPKPDNPNLVIRDNHYSPLAWATWRNRFEEASRGGWDGSDTWLFNARKQNFHIKPKLSRAKHIGYHHGIGSSADVIPTMRYRGHEPYAYAGLASANGPFVPNKDAYLHAIRMQYQKEINQEVRKALAHQIKVAEAGPFERQLLVNANGDEWIKLNDTNVKSKALNEYFQYETTTWSNDIEFNGQFYL